MLNYLIKEAFKPKTMVQTGVLDELLQADTMDKHAILEE